MTFYDNYVTHTYIHIQCNPKTLHLYNKYDKHSNKYVKDI